MDVTALDESINRIERRKALIELIKETYPDKTGVLLLCSGFEQVRHPFYQDSTFEYFVGLQEPAVMLYQPLNEAATLFTPSYSVERSAWLPETYDAERLTAIGIEKIETMGAPILGYSTGPFFEKDALSDLCSVLEAECKAGNNIFVALDNVTTECKLVLNQLCDYVSGFKECLVNIDPLVAQLRRTKTQQELEYLYHAAEITAMAHQAAAGVIRPGSSEADVQAAIEYIFTESGATQAYGTIVGSGVNSTILHYVDNNAPLVDKGVVLIDAGASFNHYCCDVTRTYPVSGRFSERQKQVYQDVLDCQAYIAGLAKPGMYLRNKQEPEKCLNTLAHKFLQDRGYDVQKAFPHGIGHFVGLDVHDVGDYSKPLAPGDIITIEPGIYLRDEALGVRIEDLYWIVKNGVVCLTEQVPKKIEEVEHFMQASRFTDDPVDIKTGPNEH